MHKTLFKKARGKRILLRQRGDIKMHVKEIV
jgi:hypothetical protein